MITHLENQTCLYSTEVETLPHLLEIIFSFRDKIYLVFASYQMKIQI